MSRWATHRLSITETLGDRPDDPIGPPGPVAQAILRPKTQQTSNRGPDGSDAPKSERAGNVLVQVPLTATDERTAVIDDRGHRPPAVAERDLRAAGEALVGHAEAGVKATCGRAPIRIPGSDARAKRGHLARVR